MEFSKKCCIGCMAYYTSGNCVLKIKMTDMPNEHHNSFIFNQIHDMYITSSLTFIDEIFESFQNLFLIKCLKMDEFLYPNWGSVIKNQCVEQR